MIGASVLQQDTDLGFYYDQSDWFPSLIRPKLTHLPKPHQRGLSCLQLGKALPETEHILSE